MHLTGHSMRCTWCSASCTHLACADVAPPSAGAGSPLTALAAAAQLGGRRTRAMPLAHISRGTRVSAGSEEGAGLLLMEACAARQLAAAAACARRRTCAPGIRQEGHCFRQQAPLVARHGVWPQAAPGAQRGRDGQQRRIVLVAAGRRGAAHREEGGGVSRGGQHAIDSCVRWRCDAAQVCTARAFALQLVHRPLPPHPLQMKSDTNPEP